MEASDNLKFDPIIESNYLECKLGIYGESQNCDFKKSDASVPQMKVISNTENRLPNNSTNNESKAILRCNQDNSSACGKLIAAFSHPLMSPIETDSDSEKSHGRLFTYPDVVPAIEPLRSNNISSISRTNNSLINLEVHNLDVTSNCSADIKNTLNIRGLSPDLVSYESDVDLSRYQANVEPNNQTVALTTNSFNFVTKSIMLKPLTRRKRPISSDILSEDISSIDSISNHLFEDDMDHNLASLSPSSSVLDDFNYKDDDFDENESTTNSQPEVIPTYTAEDERRDSRNWQKITLPDGKIKEIDMKVIEPYKRVLSHGGYLKAGGHNAIIIFCACFLPDRSRTDYHYVMENLFFYVVKTLNQLVTEDYILIYLHGASSRRNVPTLPWLKRCYQLLDRRLRKSLKNLYIVHPTFWLKSVVWMLRPFISSKFWRKLIYLRSLDDLYKIVTVEKASIPDKVKAYDSKYS